MAAAAGDGHDALAPGKTEPRLAAGAAEVFVLLAVFEAVLRLTQLSPGAGVGRFKPAVFRLTLRQVAAEHAENA